MAMNDRNKLATAVGHKPSVIICDAPHVKPNRINTRNCLALMGGSIYIRALNTSVRMQNLTAPAWSILLLTGTHVEATTAPRKTTA